MKIWWIWWRAFLSYISPFLNIWMRFYIFEISDTSCRLFLSFFKGWKSGWIGMKKLGFEFSASTALCIMVQAVQIMGVITLSKRLIGWSKKFTMLTYAELFVTIISNICRFDSIYLIYHFTVKDLEADTLWTSRNYILKI